jgi:hypothetical protein
MSVKPIMKNNENNIVVKKAEIVNFLNLITFTGTINRNMQKRRLKSEAFTN